MQSLEERPLPRLFESRSSPAQIRACARVASDLPCGFQFPGHRIVAAVLKAASRLVRKRRRRVGQGLPAGLSIPKRNQRLHHAGEVPKPAAPRERLVQLCVGLERLGDLRPAIGRRRREMMWNPWMFGLEAVQQGWQAQSALAFRLMRSFAGGVPDQTRSSPLSPHTAADDIKAQEEIAAIAHVRKAPAAIIDGQEAPAAIAHAHVAKPRRFCRPPRRYLA
jgi:hypothetical protein